jgi:predicted DNA-binding protein with PD1-like motif
VNASRSADRYAPRSAHRFAAGTIHLLRLSTGSDLYDSITAYGREHSIEVAWVNFLGAVRRASLRYYDQDAKEYRDYVLARHLEVVSGVGNLSLLDGDPFLHIHAALSDEDGAGFGGHVNSGTEVFAIEVMIHELEGDPPVRLPDECTGLTLWD